jgi:hypothetical protein
MAFPFFAFLNWLGGQISQRTLVRSVHAAAASVKENQQEERKRPLFEKSGAKTFIYAGPWAVSATKPTAQHNKVFLLLFVHKK